MSERTRETRRPRQPSPAPGPVPPPSSASSSADSDPVGSGVERSEQPSESGQPERAGESGQPGLVERVQTRLSAARRDHQASATAPRTRTPGSVGRRTAAADARRRPPARRARLRLTRIDPWTVMKTSFLLSIALGVVVVVSVLMVWSVLGAVGVWDSINATVQNILGEDSAGSFDVENYLGTSRVLGFTMIVAVVDVVLLTAIATLAAFLYNLAAALLGGVEVTLAEEER